MKSICEEHRRAGALTMLIIGWTGMQLWIIWALIAALSAKEPRIPGTLPLWVGPVGIECLLFAVTGAMVRARMRSDDTAREIFTTGLRVAKLSPTGQPEVMKEYVVLSNDETPPTGGQGA